MSGLGEEELGMSIPEASAVDMKSLLNAASREEMMQIISEMKKKQSFHGRPRVVQTTEYFASLSVQAESPSKPEHVADVGESSASPEAFEGPVTEATLADMGKRVREVYRTSMSNQAANAYLDSLPSASDVTMTKGSTELARSRFNALADALASENERYCQLRDKLDTAHLQALRQLLSEI
eukprot:CAMPEP_0185837528 /NCGR_PEP_ID=MMETSP1353-20130828/11550_1 /TAXON_ID=1077150 /ORGANISM="Erythrolobus australicus, Strain CCMP3124" /LENGTH=180 /DNA_ID=CAMNT_0028536457 /DNA_START=202 /DNA_END=744 /DNA_ORIENTATION=+